MGDHLASTIFFSLAEILSKLGKFASSIGISKNLEWNVVTYSSKALSSQCGHGRGVSFNVIRDLFMGPLCQSHKGRGQINAILTIVMVLRFQFISKIYFSLFTQTKIFSSVC